MLLALQCKDNLITSECFLCTDIWAHCQVGCQSPGWRVGAWRSTFMEWLCKYCLCYTLVLKSEIKCIKSTYRAQMWQKPLYVVHVYAIVLLKLVHPEGEEWSGRDGEAEGQSIIAAHTVPEHQDWGRNLNSPLSVYVWQVLWRSSQVFPVEMAEVQLLRLHVPTSTTTTKRRKSRHTNGIWNNNSVSVRPCDLNLFGLK